MPKPIDPVALLSAVAMTAKKAETYPAGTHVIAIEELRQIMFAVQDSELKKT